MKQLGKSANMYALQENGVVKKPSKKPNILRRKPKVSQHSKETEKPLYIPVKGDPIDIYIESGNTSQYLDEFLVPQDMGNNLNDSNIELKMESSNAELFEQFVLTDNIETCEPQSSLNVESFLINGDLKETSTFATENTTLGSEQETEDKTKWCLNFINDDTKDMSTSSYYDGSQIQISNVITGDKSYEGNEDSAAVPLAAVSMNNEAIVPQDAEKPSQNVTDLYHSTVAKLKCDMPNCTKGFWTEAKLQKHKSGHKKKSNNPANAMCPVRKTGEDGVEVKCGRSFTARDDLLKHLNEDHTLDDAAFRCSRCDRRFFWAIGMRTHEQGSCSRVYACTWAGCGRVFRQPCRLREHARVHTGDRPYPCHYPNCGWSFRSASKLMRHARRHTGERRHECGACGRAFLRREHLRDHAARHHAAPLRVCPHTGCDLTFGSVSGLCMHIRQKHRKEGEKPAKKPRTYKPKKEKNVIVVALPDGSRTEVERPPSIPPTSRDAKIVAMTMSTSQSEEQVVELQINEEIGTSLEENLELEGRAARTHCTWPLHRAHVPPVSSPPSPLAHQYDIEEDSQTDQPEGSERIYTVRSDLFLHGNVLINEDSEFTITRESRCSSTSADEAGESRGATGGIGGATRVTHADPLGFIDSHPTIGLMQEELMYADAGVDETSFRVFLLNGEELS